MKREETTPPPPLNSPLEPRTSNLNFNRLYVIVLVELAITIVILYAFTRAFQ